MKRQDFTLIVVVVVFSTVISVLLASVLIPSSSKKPQKVELVDPISADFKLPDSKYFNDKSVNPTKVIKIGDTPNQKPFSGN